MITENTKMTCPDCRGALERVTDGELLQYRCRVGHAYSGQSAVAAHAPTEENTLWAAVVALDEGADMCDEVATTLGGDTAEELRQNAKLKRELAERVRQVLRDLRAPRLP
jgi:two-component system, chemotaxis family, protein-glutamate methylesterase/glutaminase